MSNVRIYTAVSEDLSPLIKGEGFCVDMVRYSDYAALEAKCLALAAELSAVDKIHNEAEFITDDHYEQCPPEVQKIIRSLAVMQIPAYQAFLADVRAQGVEMFAFWNDKHIEKGDEYEDALIEVGRAARGFAAQLRRDAAQ